MPPREDAASAHRTAGRRSRAEKLLNTVQRPERYEEVLVRSADALIALSVWPAEDESAPTVVYLPGSMVHPLFQEEFLDALNRRGVNVVGVHFQAHGKSPRTRRPFTFDTLVANAADAVAWAADRFPGPVFALGSSQGGLVASKLAAVAGDRLAGVIAHNVVDASLRETLRLTRLPRWIVEYAHRPFGLYLRLFARLFPALPIDIAMYLDPYRAGDPRAEVHRRFLLDPLTRHTYRLDFLVSIVTTDFGFLTDGSIRCPFLVVTAAGDRLFQLEHQRAVFDRIAAPEKRFMVIDGDTHLLFDERTEEASDAIVEVVRELGRRG